MQCASKIQNIRVLEGFYLSNNREHLLDLKEKQKKKKLWCPQKILNKVQQFDVFSNQLPRRGIFRVYECS